MSDTKRKVRQRADGDESIKNKRTFAKRNSFKREDEFSLSEMLDEMYAEEEGFVFIHEKESEHGS